MSLPYNSSSFSFTSSSSTLSFFFLQLLLSIIFFFFFLMDPAPPEFSPLPPHAPLPIGEETPAPPPPPCALGGCHRRPGPRLKRAPRCAHRRVDIRLVTLGSAGDGRSGRRILDLEGHS